MNSLVRTRDWKVLALGLLRVQYLLMIFEVFNGQTRYISFDDTVSVKWCWKVEINSLKISYLQELRKQLESQVITIDRLRSDNRLAVERHENVCICYCENPPPPPFPFPFFLPWYRKCINLLICDTAIFCCRKKKNWKNQLQSLTLINWKRCIIVWRLNRRRW